MGNDDVIDFFNRYTGSMEREVVYGGQSLRWVYGTRTGRCLLRLIIKRSFFSRFYGWLMDRPSSRKRIQPFIETFGVNMSEFEGEAEDFPHFNAFFYRRLKRGARPVAGGEGIAVFPADGRHLVFPDLSNVEGVYAKGQRFSLPELTGDAGLGRRYKEGSMMISRLCPVDYHRFHFCSEGVAGEPHLLNGSLHSVNPLALRRNLRYLWENRRMRTLLDTPGFGRVLCIEIGATCVGSIRQSYAPGEEVRRGDEKGFFAFGGSCVILLFEPGRISFDEDVAEKSRCGVETYARMGDRMGTRLFCGSVSGRESW
ncbi:MAG: phosphatidylserine decarboxylase [Opitutales bacterium]